MRVLLYGARPLRRAIQQRLQNPLARMLIAGELTDGSKVTIGRARRRTENRPGWSGSWPDCHDLIFFRSQPLGSLAAVAVGEDRLCSIYTAAHSRIGTAGGVMSSHAGRRALKDDAPSSLRRAVKDREPPINRLPEWMQPGHGATPVPRLCLDASRLRRLGTME